MDNDVIAKIQANAPFLNITVIKVDLGTPTVATLEGYQTVLLMNNNPFADGVTLGNNLAQYISDGHGLVVAGSSNTYGNCTPGGYQLCGNFQTGDYWAIEPGASQSGGNLTLGTIYVPGSPLLTGVSTFNGGSISSRVNGAVNANATRVADWSNGTPLIVSRAFASGATEVALNFYLPSSDAWSGLWLSNTDGGKIITNALLTAGDISASDPVPEPNYLVAGAGLALVSLLFRRRR